MAVAEQNSLQCVKKLLSDVVLAKGVFEGEVKLVLFFHHPEAGERRVFVTRQRAAAAVHVHFYVLLEGLDNPNPQRAEGREVITKAFTWAYFLFKFP